MEESEFDVHVYTSGKNVDIASNVYSVKILDLNVDPELTRK